MDRVEDFLRRERLTDPETQEAQIRHFLQEMEAGLAGRRSSLLMAPAYQSRPVPPETGRKLLLIDTGGTHLRIAQGQFDGYGWNFQELSRCTMPGVSEPVPCESFFDFLAQQLLPYLANSYQIAFCFSYTLKHLPNRDAVVVSLAKQVCISGIEGRRVAEELRRAFRRAGFTGEGTVSVLNDVVAVLLAGASLPNCEEFSDIIAMVMGTGINFSYFERNRPGWPETAVNVESSRYSGFPRAPADEELDAGLEDLGAFPLEKSVAGRYLGPLTLTVLKRACQAGCFSEAAAERLTAVEEFSTETFSTWLDTVTQKDQLSADERTFAVIADAVLERAARRTAACLTALMRRTDAPATEEHPIGLIVEGSTFNKFTALREKLLREIESTAGWEGLHFRLLQVEDAVLIGSAAAGAKIF